MGLLTKVGILRMVIYIENMNEQKWGILGKGKWGGAVSMEGEQYQKEE